MPSIIDAIIETGDSPALKRNLLFNKRIADFIGQRLTRSVTKTASQFPDPREPLTIKGLSDVLAILPIFGAVARAKGFQAAVKDLNTGTILTGEPIHAMLRNKAMKRGFTNLEDGFIDGTGKYFNRAEAFKELEKELPDLRQPRAGELETFALFDAIHGPPKK